MLTCGCGKMEGVMSINTNPLTNPFCQKMAKMPTSICARCYSRALLSGMFKHIATKFERNSQILCRPLTPSNMPDTTGQEFVRYHAHGELLNEAHLRNFLAIAEHNPDTTFTLWTKRLDLTGEIRKPDNLILIYSTPEVNASPHLPEGFDKTFTAYTAQYALEHAIEINCEGKCSQCRKCYAHTNIPEIREVVKHEHALYDEKMGKPQKTPLRTRLNDYLKGRDRATLTEIYAQFPEEEEYVIRARLNEGVDRGLLKRIEKGTYSL